MVRNSDRRTDAAAAGERFFRSYLRFCTDTDSDSVFHLLETMHTMDERFARVGSTLLDVPEFLALKALRNLFHHETELVPQMRPIPTQGLSINADLLLLCLVPRRVVDQALREVRVERWRQEATSAAQDVFRWYGEVVDINPAIFNFSVKLFERMSDLNLDLSGDAFDVFADSYQQEEESGRTHLTEGRINTHGANVGEVLRRLMQGQR